MAISEGPFQRILVANGDSTTEDNPIIPLILDQGIPGFSWNKVSASSALEMAPSSLGVEWLVEVRRKNYETRAPTLQEIADYGAADVVVDFNLPVIGTEIISPIDTNRYNTERYDFLYGGSGDRLEIVSFNRVSVGLAFINLPNGLDANLVTELTVVVQDFVVQSEQRPIDGTSSRLTPALGNSFFGWQADHEAFQTGKQYFTDPSPEDDQVHPITGLIAIDQIGHGLRYELAHSGLYTFSGRLARSIDQYLYICSGPNTADTCYLKEVVHHEFDQELHRLHMSVTYQAPQPVTLTGRHFQVTYEKGEIPSDLANIPSSFGSWTANNITRFGGN